MTELLGVILIVGLLAIVISTAIKGMLRIVSFIILGLIAASALGVDLSTTGLADLWSTLRNKVAQLEQAGDSVLGGGGQPPAQSETFDSRTSRSPYSSQPYSSQQYNSQPYGSQPYSTRSYNSQPYNSQQNPPASDFTSTSSQAPAQPNSRPSSSSPAANNPGISQSADQPTPSGSSFPRPRRATPATERRPVAAWW